MREESEVSKMRRRLKQTLKEKKCDEREGKNKKKKIRRASLTQNFPAGNEMKAKIKRREKNERRKEKDRENSKTKENANIKILRR